VTLPTVIEGPDVVPTVIFPEAWDSAMVIDQEVYNLMAEYGLKRIEGASKMITSIALLVQLAINKSYARIVAEIEAEDAANSAPEPEKESR
jgi:hypothetical protein